MTEQCHSWAFILNDFDQVLGTPSPTCTVTNAQQQVVDTAQVLIDG